MECFGMTTKIELKSMRFYAYHGVDPQETRVGNWFIVEQSILFRLLKMITWIVQLIMQRYMRLLSRK